MSTTSEAGNPSNAADTNVAAKSTDELRSLLNGLGKATETKPESSLPEATATEKAAETSTTTDTAAETPATDTPPTEGETKTDPAAQTETQATEKTEDTDSDLDTDDGLKKRRVRPRSDLDQQVIDLYKSEGFKGTFADAVKVIYQNAAPSKPTSESQQTVEGQPDPLKRFDDAVTSVKAEIADLEKKVSDAADALDTAKALKLQQELFRKEIALRTVESEKETFISQQRARVASTLRTKAEESRDAVFTEYPVLKDTNSTERKQFDAFVAEKQADPDYADIFVSPRWPQLMAREFAASKSLKSAKVSTPASLTNPTPAKPVATRPAPVATNTKVLTSAENASSKPQPVTEDQLRSDLTKLSKDDLFKLLSMPVKRR